MDDPFELEEFDKKLVDHVEAFLESVDPFLEKQPEYTYLAILDNVYMHMIDYCFDSDDPLESVEATNSIKRMMDEDLSARFRSLRYAKKKRINEEEEYDD